MWTGYQSYDKNVKYEDTDIYHLTLKFIPGLVLQRCLSHGSLSSESSPSVSPNRSRKNSVDIENDPGIRAMPRMSSM